MSSVAKSSETGKLTFGSLLRMLHALSINHYHNQVAMYIALFRSYCVYRGEPEGQSWEPSQGSVSRLFADRQLPSWYQYNWYINIDQRNIRDDVQQYLQCVATTHKVRRLHMEQLESLVAGSNNIDAQDRDYILAYVDVGEETALEELLYRILVVLYNEPC